METIKQLQRFYVAEVFRLQPLIPGSQGSETISLPNGTSAFDQRQCTTRVNRKLVEGISRSTHLRSRFPLHPSWRFGWSIHRGVYMKCKILDLDKSAIRNPQSAIRNQKILDPRSSISASLRPSLRLS